MDQLVDVHTRHQRESDWLAFDGLGVHNPEHLLTIEHIRIWSMRGGTTTPNDSKDLSWPGLKLATQRSELRGSRGACASVEAASVKGAYVVRAGERWSVDSGGARDVDGLR
jgi:hypothetical protein